jgi:ceramide glucosyltransferase
MKREHPGKLEVVVRRTGAGYNPKVSNLIGMISEARHDMVVVSDSNVRVGEDYLRSNVGYFREPRVGLVTNLVRGLGAGSPGALMENLHLNSFIAGNMCLSDLLIKKKLVVGKSMFFRLSQIRELGGLERFANYLAEDYLMGKAYDDAGFEVVISPYTVDTWNRQWSIEQFVSRHTRWAKMRLHINWPAYVGEGLMNFPWWGAVHAVATGPDGGGPQVLVLLWLLKMLGDLIVNRTLGSPLPWWAVAASPVKDMVVALIHPLAMISPRTKWRGHRLHVGRGTLLAPAKGAGARKWYSVVVLRERASHRIDLHDADR